MDRVLIKDSGSANYYIVPVKYIAPVILTENIHSIVGSSRGDIIEGEKYLFHTFKLDEHIIYVNPIGQHKIAKFDFVTEPDIKERIKEIIEIYKTKQAQNKDEISYQIYNEKGIFTEVYDLGHIVRVLDVVRDKSIME